MTLSYTEELVSEYLKHLEENGKPKYFISEHVHFRGKKKIKGWRDIDILAIGKGEILIVQTKGYFYTKSKRGSVEDTINFFEEAEKFVRNSYEVNNKSIRKIFVADFGLTKPVQQDLRNAGIETKTLKDIIREYFDLLLRKYPKMPAEVGKEENNVTRILICLLYHFKKEFKKAGLL